MNKLVTALAVSVPLVLLSGCAVETVSVVDTVAYDPGYTNDYVYSVGYYNNRPYWRNNYYYSSYWDNYGYWGGGYYNGY